MDDQVRIPSDGRREMGIGLRGQAEVALILAEYLAHFIDRRRMLLTTFSSGLPFASRRTFWNSLGERSEPPLLLHLVPQVGDKSSKFLDGLP